jgi:hypothetical protein
MSGLTAFELLRIQSDFDRPRMNSTQSALVTKRSASRNGSAGRPDLATLSICERHRPGGEDTWQPIYGAHAVRPRPP